MKNVKKPTNADLADAFYLAANVLKTKDINYICAALDYLARSELIEECTFYAAKTHVMDRLGGSWTVTSWLIKNGYLDSNSFYGGAIPHKDYKEVHNYRIRWCEHLSKEFGKC